MTPLVEPTQTPPFVRWLIEAYLRLPDTPDRARPQDHDLAAQIHERGVPATIVEAAFLLATLRRAGRPPNAPPLNPIRSLRYFLPVIEELLQQLPSPAYLTYLRETTTTRIDTVSLESGPKKDVFT